MRQLEEYQATLFKQIELHHELRKRAPVERDHDGFGISHAYLRDFCVVRSDIGMRTGKSRFAETFVKSLPSSKKVLIISMQALSITGHLCSLRNHVVRCSSDYCDLINSFQPNMGMTNEIPYYDYVIIDPATWVADIAVDPKFESLFSQLPTKIECSPPTFILLG